MPKYQLQDFEIDINRQALLIDTNVLVAYNNPAEEKHEPTVAFIQTTDRQLVLFYATIVEAWGLLVSRKKLNLARNMVHWLTQPGSGIDIIPSHFDPFSEIYGIISSYEVDCVDALLVHFAHSFSVLHDFRPPMMIATYDSKDFYYLCSNFRVGKYDPQSGEEIYVQR